MLRPELYNNIISPYTIKMLIQTQYKEIISS